MAAMTAAKKRGSKKSKATLKRVVTTLSEGCPPEVADLPPLLSLAQVAEFRGCSKWLVRKALDLGTLSWVGIENAMRISRAELTRYLSERMRAGGTGGAK